MRRFLILLLSILLLAAMLACGLPEIQQMISAITPAPSALIPSDPPAQASLWDCPGNVLLNGGFEQAGEGWTYNGTEHGQEILTLPLTQGAQTVHGGESAALLGGFENASDNLSQTFIVPPNGQLSLWWIYNSPDPIKERDTLLGRIILPDSEDGLPVFYAGGDALQEIWQQTIVDLSDYAGQRLTLEFSTYNDNYYASWLALDDICIEAAP